MATFYGGEQLLEVKKLKFESAPGADANDQVIYTVPTGRLAFIQLYGVQEAAFASYHIFDPDLDDNSSFNAETKVYELSQVATSTNLSALRSTSTPSAIDDQLRNDITETVFGPPSGLYFEGAQLRVSYSNVSSQRLRVVFMIHEYARP